MLAELPRSISCLTNLKQLYAKSNRIKEIHGGIGRCLQLESVDLSGNSLQCLPSEVGQLTNLAALFLGRNSLEEVPEGICMRPCW
jgi:Leucine-rich repeat (LRR) protein